MPTLKNGLLIDPKVHQRVFPGLEKGPLNSVNALVIHQTGASTAQHTFNSYQKSSYGAHFLIDKSGKIYQTANLEKKAYHVGKIKSKCYENNNCKKAELQTVTSILFAQGKRYSTRISNLHSYEKAKSYPDRFPLNLDSLGIEIVGEYDAAAKSYESVSPQQNTSLQWLIGTLYQLFSLTKADIYRHPDVSYKMPSEAGTAKW